MKRQHRLLLALTLLLALAGSAAAEAQPPAPADAGGNVSYLPLVAISPGPPSPFGFDVRDYARDDVLAYAREANPIWVRTGDVRWAEVEKQPGVYDWSALSAVEANIRRLRQLGFEPIVVVQQTPSWAQRTPGRLCSPPKPEYFVNLAQFMLALSQRYASGPTAVNYYEFWNEPDYTPGETQDSQGFGCWVDAGLPHYGGDYYGNVLRVIYPAIKAGNPNATVLAGALAHQWPVDTISLEFLRGIAASGAGGSFDALSFHAYGEWGAGDLLLAKTSRIRAVLAEYGLGDKPLFATEIAATCYSVLNSTGATCPADFERRQANYAARIYAEAKALHLYGALWFSLVATGPDVISNGQLIDDANGQLAPRPSFYSFRNSARLLQGTTYSGAPPVEPPASQLGEVQTLVFRKGKNTLYVIWVPVTDFPKPYSLEVPPGSTAICTDQLNLPTPATYYCTDVNKDGLIPRAVNELPQYIEVVGP